MERPSTTFALVLLCTATAVHAKLGAPGGPRKLHYDVPDAFEVISAFPFSVAIMDSDNDTIFECLTSNRTHIDYETKKATFVWTVGGTRNVPKQEVPFFVSPGPTPGTMDMLIGDACRANNGARLAPDCTGRATSGGCDSSIVNNICPPAGKYPDVKEGIFYYFGQDCIVMDLEYRGLLCILWTARYLMHHVPPECIDQFVDTCGVDVDPRRRDLCPDD